MQKRKLAQYEDDAATHTSSKRSADLDHQRTATHSTGNDESRHSENPADALPASRSASAETLAKLSKLMESLDAVLDSSGADEGSQVLSEQTLHRCRRLHSSLTRDRDQLSMGKDAVATSADVPALNTTVIPRTIPTAFLPPWTSEMVPKTLPPLPSIKDPALEKAAFTHSGMLGSRAQAMSYERLEWIGDAYIYLISVLLIARTFDDYTPGQCSYIRELLVKNENLASYSRQYGFDVRVQLPPAFGEGKSGAAMRRGDLIKVQGDVFEAYVAAVILSDPEHGLQTVAEWLRLLFSRTVADKIRQHEKDVRKKMQMSEAERDVSPKVLLSQALVCPGVKLSYKDVAPERKEKDTKRVLYTIGVFLDGWGEANKQLGFGSGASKKDAGEKAATMALGNKKLLKPFEDMKQVYKEKMERDAAQRSADEQ